jgi:ubiquinone/menaquinone biosynthesis C-methylase UbiE
LANLYSHYVLPRLIHYAMNRDEMRRLRAAHIPAARGVVLDVGIGSGLNLPFYTGAVTKLYGVDRSPELLERAGSLTAAAPFPVELLNQDADRLSLANVCVDTVVVTWSLCSIANTTGALSEMRRVLKPGGAVIFIEHGLSPDAGVRKWQDRLTPVWRRCAGGCHLNRKTDDLLRGAGFTIESLQTGYLAGPRALTFMYEGVARKT